MFPPLAFARGTLDWSRTYVMGVVNVTPDSFSDGGRFVAPDAAVVHALALEAAGADVVDIGGESTRPGAAPVAEADERARVAPVIAALRARGRGLISIDTTKATVADAALAAGADVVNDVSGARLDPDVLRVTARHGAAIVLGHLRGTPATMQHAIRFDDVVREVADELLDAAARAEAAGVARARIVFDPGLGFGKSAAQTIELLRRLGELRERAGGPVCVGASRKSFIGAITGAPAGERLMGTAAATAIAIANGADIVRVHDVAELRQAIAVADAIRRGT